MRTLNRNKQKLYYALYEGKVEVLDANGYNTGEKRLKYGEPQLAKMSIGPAYGSINLTQYGKMDSSIKTLITDDMNCPIDMNTVLWIDVPITEPYDYTVIQPPKKSLNSISITVKKVASS